MAFLETPKTGLVYRTCSENGLTDACVLPCSLSANVIEA